MSAFAVLCPPCHASYDMDIAGFEIGDLTHDQGAATVCKQCGMPLLYSEGEWEEMTSEVFLDMPAAERSKMLSVMFNILRKQSDEIKNSGPSKPVDGGLLKQGGDPQTN